MDLLEAGQGMLLSWLILVLPIARISEATLRNRGIRAEKKSGEKTVCSLSL